ncbi:MAG TPA: sulfotransferase family protein [Flavobacteriales bacterium]|nr:sulfotransferase family protein [Flavobacteriales bacterium]
MKKIICLWSCPRNISTALMYAFAQREDTKVFDEPLYAHYLKVSGAKHPAREQVLQALENDGNKVVQEVILQKSEKLLFHKLMTHFLIGIDTEFLSEVMNIIFIRNPEEIITSYSKVIPNPKMKNIGVKQQYELYLSLEERGKTPIVLDSKYLLQNPELILSELCSLLGISFDEKMLKWEKGARKEDGIWASYWYKNIHNSTGFLPYAEKEITLTNSNAELAEECLPYYEFLTAKSIQS